MKQLLIVTLIVLAGMILPANAQAQNTGPAAPNQPGWRQVQHQQAMAMRRGRIGGR